MPLYSWNRKDTLPCLNPLENYLINLVQIWHIFWVNKVLLKRKQPKYFLKKHKNYEQDPYWPELTYSLSTKKNPKPTNKQLLSKRFCLIKWNYQQKLTGYFHWARKRTFWSHSTTLVLPHSLSMNVRTPGIKGIILPHSLNMNVGQV